MTKFIALTSNKLFAAAFAVEFVVNVFVELAFFVHTLVHMFGKQPVKNVQSV